MRSYLDFEKPVADLQGKVQELRSLEKEGDAVAIGEEIARLEAKAAQALGEIYAKLTPWQKTQVARHPDRPHTSDYARRLIEDFVPLAGDRKFGEDAAIVAGLGFFRGRRVALIGHEKGNDTESRIKHNFGMARPEGYRKAVRVMQLADRFGLPVVSLVDTAGAYPGIEAEERGQAEAIARSTEACVNLGVPNVAIVIGEGGSGGAIAIAAANKVLMLEHSIYTVISPEGAASILWHDSEPGAGRRHRHEDHRGGPAAVRRHRPDHRRTGRRRPSRAGSDDQGDRRRHRRGAGVARQPAAGGGPPPAPREVSGDRPNALGRAALRLPHRCGKLAAPSPCERQRAVPVSTLMQG